MEQRYTPYLPAIMMRVYATNYAQLCRLLPHNDKVGETVTYQVNAAPYRLTLNKSTRYTSLVEIEQTFRLEPARHDSAAIS